MSDFLKKFKSVFIIEEPEKSTPQPSAAPQKPESQPVVNPAPAAAPSHSGTGAVTDKFMEILLSALEKNNQPGFDYMEFRQSLKNLAKMPMDEATRYHSAYAMAQTMGVTSAKLLESAQYYLNVLVAEQSKFNEAHAQQRARLIGNREEEIRNLEAAVQQKAEQIKQLTQQMEEHRQRSEQIRAEIDSSTVKIETTKADFEATFSAVTGQIQQDAAKIQQYLNA
ncbi:MAG TPA: hypothetical protein PK971_00195 [Saprospiraceae bacterium]|nr:hypothetical protein [Saprospiraceae bacterium]HND86709.1 hypothetical protein [Saprospiraceae bacterium]